MTLNYFAPDRRYAYDKTPGGPTREFKAMVKAFHDAGHQGLRRRGLQPHR
jgi:isoamylase